MRRWRCVCLAATLAVLASCEPAGLGQSPTILWWTDYETADLSDVTEDNHGGTWKADEGSLSVTTTQSRSGQYAMRASVVSPSAGGRSMAMVYRTGVGETEAYYSAWFYIPEPIDSTEYWLFFKFRSRTEGGSGGAETELWDLDIGTPSDSQMRFTLFGHGLAQQLPVSPIEVPIARWFQVEAFLRATGDETGCLRYWLDGQLLYEITDQPTVPSGAVEWAIGGMTESISPSTATLYVDDAAVGTERFGPDYPVFWRSQ